jgi:hypothetical protein
MPPSQAVLVERMVKRVENAIHNPTQSVADVRDAIDNLKSANIRVFKDEIDRWIRLAIESNNKNKVRCLIKRGLHTETMLGRILENSPHHIAQYIASPLYTYDRLQEGSDLIELMQPFNERLYDPAIKILFKQPRATQLCSEVIDYLTKKGWKSGKSYQTLLFSLNPVLKKRKQQHKILLRFWLLTAKPAIRNFKESLYVPGSGALYKKALASFTNDDRNEHYVLQDSSLPL